MGYRSFLILTRQEFDHMGTNHSDLNNRLHSLLVELAEALVPIRGPLPPGIVKMLSELKTAAPRADTVRNDGPATSPKLPLHDSGLPAQ
jgi:hypothetical protein